MNIEIGPHREGDDEAILALSLRAWAPVFAAMEPAVPTYVYQAFYPDGWRVRQAADVRAILSDEAIRVLVATVDSAVVGWAGVGLHPEDQMGELHILAVDPAWQRRGVATRLIAAALDLMRDAGMAIAMVETGDDPGHAASRATYADAGFARWPVARYFRKL
jgi:GNAT superfamily N-acetyltransferase